MNRNLIVLFWCTYTFLTTVSDASAAEHRIISLSPHLTEWVYLLEQEAQLVGVSAYSDYPPEANNKPVVADANGVNFTQLMALTPNLILVWQGGNKPQEIARLKSLGYAVFESSPQQLTDISAELLKLGALLGVSVKAQKIAQDFTKKYRRIASTYQQETLTPVFYYLWTKPLMTIGNEAWGNRALNICGAQTLFVDAPSDYPEVRLAEVIKRRPRALVTTMQGSNEELRQFWSSHEMLVDIPIITVNPDIMHRFTPRILDEIETLCERIPH